MKRDRRDGRSCEYSSDLFLHIMADEFAGPTLLDVLRLPSELCSPCALADVAACALTSKAAHLALREAHNGPLPRATLRILCRDLRRFQWAVSALGISIDVGDDRAACAAAAEGAIETLQWIAERQMSSDAPLGLQVAPLVRSAGRGASVNWSVAVCREAAKEGHLDIVRYLRLMLGCPWDGSVCANAAAGGHLNVLQWLRDKGCPWHKDTPAWAELNGHHAVKDWAIANGCDYSEDLVLRLRMSRMMAAMNDNRAPSGTG